MLIVGHNRKIYHFTKGQDKKPILYQELKIVVVGRNKKIYYPTKT